MRKTVALLCIVSICCLVSVQFGGAESNNGEQTDKARLKPGVYFKGDPYYDIVKKSNVWIPIVLKVDSCGNDGMGNLTIKFASGQTVTVLKNEWSKDWSDAVGDAIKKQNTKAASQATSSEPTETTVMTKIQRHCRGEWPDDFKMQKYCQDQQHDGWKALQSRQMSGYPLSTVRSKCASEWPDDFKMRDYCEGQQLKALRDLNQ